MIDSIDVEASVRFWSGVLGLDETHRFEEYVFLEDVVPGTHLAIQSVDEVPSAKSPIHFDIEPADFSRFEERVLGLGGTRVERVQTEHYDLVVMADPSGNVFCVNRSTSERVRTGSDEGR